MYFQTPRLVGCSSFSYIGWGIKVSEWVLNQSWGLPVLLAFLVIVFVFESRKAFKAYQEKDVLNWDGPYCLRLWLYWRLLSWWLINT